MAAAAVTAPGAVPEPLLVKDVLTSCQAINGRYVWLQGSGDASARFACGPGAEVPAAQQQLVGRVAELGWLLRRVAELAAACSSARSAVHEAVAAAAQREVSSYCRLVAILEAQAARQAGGSAAATLTAAPVAAAPTDGGASGVGELTLRRLEVWLADPLARLRVLAGCLEAAQPLRGGQLVNCLHAQSKHGDTLVRQVAGPLLEAACVPLFKQVARWVLDGALDPFASSTTGDFMVRRCKPANDHPATLWKAGFVLDPAMQPRFISGELAEEVLTAGKTIHFLRECCGDTAWAAKLTAAAQDLASYDGTWHQLQWLEGAVRDVNRGVSVHLRDIVLVQHELPRHLSALKRFLLLGQGDFVQSLLDLVAPELDKPAKEVSLYVLQGHLDAALRFSSTASEDSDLQHRLSVRLARTMDGDRGWDVFSLQYLASEAPLAVVLSPEAMGSYLRIFRLLWAVKHTEQVLVGAWAAVSSASHGLAAMRNVSKDEGVEVEGADEVPALLRFFQAKRADMAQFLTSLQYYLLFEVLEPGWARLLAALPAVASLDSLIALHKQALREISEGMFLAEPAGMGEAGTAAGGGAAAGIADVQAALRATLRAVLDLAGPVRRLSALVEQAVAEQQLYVQRVRESEEAGAWNEQVYNSPSVDEALLAELHSGMRRVHANFDRSLKTFLSLLPAHSDRLFLSGVGSGPGASAAPVF
eukprot:scaffold27.g6021.t1